MSSQGPDLEAGQPKNNVLRIPFSCLTKSLNLRHMFLPGKKYLTLSCEETLFFFPVHFSLDYLTGVLVLQRDFLGYTERKSVSGGGTKCLSWSMSLPTSCIAQIDWRYQTSPRK